MQVNHARASTIATTMPDTDYTKFQANLGWAPINRVKATFQNTTQMATQSTRLPMQQHFKSRYPQLNHPRLGEAFSTDTFFSSTKGIRGESCAQLYVRKKSLYTKTYGMSSESQGQDTLESFIANVGAPYHIHSDNAQMERSKAWKEVLRK